MDPVVVLDQKSAQSTGGDVIVGEDAQAGENEAFYDPDLDRQSEGEPEKEELEALLEILTEAFNEMDVENSGVITVEQLGQVLDTLVEEDVILPCTDEELEILANDMDIDRSGLIPLEEFKDVLVRRQQGYDFTEIELKEAFDVFDVNGQNEIGVRELRAVMQALSEVEVRALDGRRMIEAACGDEKKTVTFEQFKAMIRWRKADEGLDADQSMSGE